MNWKSLTGAITLSGIIGGVSGYLVNQGNYGEVGSNYPIAFSGAAFKVASSDTGEVLFNLASPRQKLTKIVVEVTTAFSGTGITAMTCSVGTDTAGNHAVYAQALNVMQTAETVSQGGVFSGRDLATPDSSLGVVLYCTATGANFGNGSTTVLTQGALAVTVYTVKLPAVTVRGTPGVDAGVD